MIPSRAHAADCDCALCYWSVTRKKYLVCHVRGDVEVRIEVTLTPAQARQLADHITCAAEFAKQWRASQLEAAGIQPAPDTQRSPLH